MSRDLLSVHIEVLVALGGVIVDEGDVLPGTTRNGILAVHVLGQSGNPE